MADLTDEDDRARIVSEAEAALGGSIEILINNAAAAIYQPLAEFSLKRRRLIFEANVHAPIDLAQAVIPAMLRTAKVGSSTCRAPPQSTRGSAVRMEGLASATGVYGASKAALNRETNALAHEL